MADPTVDATAKGANSNSYVTRAEAQTYFDGRLNVANWTAASDANKDRALIMATARLDQEAYEGTPTTTTQALKWPRSGTFDSDGIHWDQDVVPAPVKEATYETALELLDGSLTLAPTGLEGYLEVIVGTIEVTPRHGRASGALSDQVRRLLRGLLIGGGSLASRTVKT